MATPQSSKTSRPTRSTSRARPKPQPTRREIKAQATREALLGAALEVMSSRGVYFTRIEDITNAADVAKGSFYAHFSDKDDILAAVLTRLVQELEARIQQSAITGRGIRARVQRLLDSHLRFFVQEPGRMVVMHQARGIVMQEEASFPHVKKALGEYVSLVANSLANDQPQDRKVVEQAALALAGLVNGYLSFCFALGKRKVPSREQEALQKAALGVVDRFLDSSESADGA